ncbi:MAG: DUF177 domain-containing protein [Promicromonosporaceae bacterium]|nr:DUF177 domain-containing protein [Promicromonosporaceae bacterium]
MAENMLGAEALPGEPLVIDTHQLARRPGTMLEFKKVIPAPPDLRNEMIGIPTGDPLTVGLRLESVLEGILVTGVVRGVAVGECSRCLEPVTETVTARVNELFVYPERAQAAYEAGDDADDGEDLAVLDGDTANIEPAIRDAIVTALPFRPLCQEECQGLCPQCGARLDENPDHFHEVADPRWSALHAVLAEHGTKES